MTEREAILLAERAAQAWGGFDAPPQLIRNRENIVFEVHLKHGGHAALRLHRAGYQTTPAIEAELLWTERLAEAGLRCPRPLHTVAGGLTEEAAFGPVASAVAWIEADPIGENGVPFAGTTDAHCALNERVGALIGTLHRTTDAIETHDIARPSWNADALLGETPRWGRFWDNPALYPEEVALLQDARRIAAQHLARLDLPVRLIHADLLQENILSNDEGLWLIDFDDSGYGYAGYDLGTALIQHAESSDFDALSRALVAGYQTTAGPAAWLAETVPLFTMLRSMASCGWIISRAKPDDARQRFYAKRAVLCAERYLQTTTSSSSCDPTPNTRL